MRSVQELLFVSLQVAAVGLPRRIRTHSSQRLRPRFCWNAVRRRQVPSHAFATFLAASSTDFNLFGAFRVVVTTLFQAG